MNITSFLSHSLKYIDMTSVLVKKHFATLEKHTALLKHVKRSGWSYTFIVLHINK